MDSDSAVKRYLIITANERTWSSGSAAQTVNKVWSDVDSWWYQKSIQSARKQFCEHYACTSKKPIRDLRKILDGNI
jgi:hypothetical protein